jgi:secondary thiamine-phosphate synthase enzyme
VDVAGAGGTSWSEVERHRMTEPWRGRVAAAFAGWGLPTAHAVRLARRAAPEAEIFASGGIRDGVDVAKALALGADLVGVAGPFLRAAVRGSDAAHELARELIEALRISMFCVDAESVAELKCTNRLVNRLDPEPEIHRDHLRYLTGGGGQFIDITDDVEAAVARSPVHRGLAHVYSRHTTAAIRINENEPLLLADFGRFLEQMAPVGSYDHDDMERRLEVPRDEPRNGHAHCRHLLLSSSETIPVDQGRLELGRWQRIFLIELCSSRLREVAVQVLGR